MRSANVESSATSKVTRTKILRGGVRVRAAKPGETREQQKKWQDRLVQKGIASTVFPTQAMLDDYCASVKAMFKREDFRNKLERMYLAGELVKAKPSKHKSVSS